jgi:prepilin-type N-terminal cleavage/methylation domain-containing protein
MKRINKKGISMLEIIIAITVIGIIVAIVIPQFSKLRNAQIIKSSGQEIFSLVERARSQTLASLDSSEYGVHFENDKAVLFKGIVYSGNSSDNEEVEITHPAEISNINLSGGATSVYFTRLTGIPSVSGNIEISIPGQNTMKIISIATSGAISLN